MDLTFADDMRDEGDIAKTEQLLDECKAALDCLIDDEGMHRGYAIEQIIACHNLPKKFDYEFLDNNL